MTFIWFAHHLGFLGFWVLQYLMENGYFQDLSLYSQICVNLGKVVVLTVLVGILIELVKVIVDMLWVIANMIRNIAKYCKNNRIRTKE